MWQKGYMRIIKQSTNFLYHTCLNFWNFKWVKVQMQQDMFVKWIKVQMQQYLFVNMP